MNDNQTPGSAGEQIKEALSDALLTGDFSALNELVAQTLSDTLNDAGQHIAQSINSAANTKGTDQGSQRRAKEFQQEQLQRQRKEEQERQRERQRKQQEEQQKRQLEQQRKRLEEQKRRLEQQRKQQEEQQRKWLEQQKKQRLRQDGQAAGLSLVRFKEVGSVSNVLYQVFGGIGLGFSALIALLRLPGAFFGAGSAAGWIVNIAFLLFFFFMIRFGVSQKNRLKRAKRYIQLCGGRMYGQIENLALDTGNSVRYVIKDIRRMLSLGMFPEGHLDDKKTCFMLNDSIHRQYLETKNNQLLREKEKNRVLEQPAPQTNNRPEHAPDADNAELNTMIAEGMECIRRLRELNDNIPGEIISDKLYRLENLLKDIFDSVREHPEQMHRMHNMMDYYLPTTLKLVEAYEDFDKVSTPGEEITSAKAEIEHTLDIINQAFAELLSNLFQDAVLDATTDAQVIKTMLAREGLTNINTIQPGGTSNEQ